MPTVFIGPIFQSDVPTVVKGYCNRIEQSIADEGQRRVRTNQRLSFRYESGPPTGHAGSSVRSIAAAGVHVVTDSDIVYGRWLEGVSSRNHATRFKGYAIFRRATQTLDGMAVKIAQPLIDAMCRQLS